MGTAPATNYSTFEKLAAPGVPKSATAAAVTGQPTLKAVTESTGAAAPTTTATTTTTTPATNTNTTNDNRNTLASTISNPLIPANATPGPAHTSGYYLPDTGSNIVFSGQGSGNTNKGPGGKTGFHATSSHGGRW